MLKRTVSSVKEKKLNRAHTEKYSSMFHFTLHHMSFSMLLDSFDQVKFMLNIFIYKNRNDIILQKKVDSITPKRRRESALSTSVSGGWVGGDKQHLPEEGKEDTTTINKEGQGMRDGESSTVPK